MAKQSKTTVKTEDVKEYLKRKSVEAQTDVPVFKKTSKVRSK